MALWLEHRDEKGDLLDQVPCTDKRFIFAPDDSGESLVLSIDQARELCRPSNGLPFEKRDWVLRLSFADQDY